MDLELLKEIGLTEGEIKVYVALFKLGSTSTGALIKESKVHASKVYPILDRLIEKGLVSFVKEGKKTIYSANPATTIISYLDKLQNKITNQKKSADQLIKELTKLKEFSSEESETTVFKGSKGLKNAYNIAIQDLREGDTIYSMFLPKVDSKLLNFFEKLITSLSKKKVEHYLLYNELVPEMKMIENLPRVNVKINSPQGYHSPAEMCVYGNYTLISTSGGEEYLTILIKDSTISNSFKNQFKIIWDQKVNTYYGKEGVKLLLNSMLETDSKEYFAYGGPQKAHDLLENHFWRSFHEKRVKAGIDAKLVFHASLGWWGAELNKFTLTKVRTTEKNFEELTETVICGNKVAIIFWTDNPFGILIKEPLAANSYKKFFDLIWVK